MNEQAALFDQKGPLNGAKVETVEIRTTSQDGQFKYNATLKVIFDSSLSKRWVIIYPNPTQDEIRPMLCKDIRSG